MGDVITYQISLYCVHLARIRFGVQLYACVSFVLELCVINVNQL